jgi:hypothetical protein
MVSARKRRHQVSPSHLPASGGFMKGTEPAIVGLSVSRVRLTKWAGKGGIIRMIGKRVGATVALLTLASCQTFEDIDTGLAGLRGRPYQAAFDVLGFPDAENRIAGKRVFTWGSRNTGSYTVPTFNSSTAYVNGKPIYIQTQGTATETYDYYCKIDVIVGSSGLIEHYKFDGNIGGCERYARLLRSK